MKINLNVLRRPRDGHEAEYEQLVDWIDTSHWGMPQQPHPYVKQGQAGVFGLWRRKDVFDSDAAIARFNEISEHPGSTLNAPVVGRDSDANKWAQDAVTKGWLKAKTPDDAVTRYKGLYVYDLMTVNDGFPIYSPNKWDKGYDRTTLYATVIAAYEDQIGNDLTTYLYGPLLASELAEWAGKLRRWADDYAQKHQMQAILGDREFISDDDGGPETVLHIVDQAARWASFWSAKGHGAEPSFDAE